MFEEIKLNPLNKFYPLNIDAIKKSESKLGLDIPQLLKEFYIEVGYGFIKSKVDNVNRVMDPESVLDFRLRQNDFEFYPDIEIFDDFEEDKLVFFEANDTVMISIGFGSNNYGKIYYYDMEISKNLKEFFDKLLEDDTFYYNLFQLQIMLVFSIETFNEFEEMKPSVKKDKLKSFYMVQSGYSEKIIANKLFTRKLARRGVQVV